MAAFRVWWVVGLLVGISGGTASLTAQVVLNEVMVDAAGPERSHEFVELFNPGKEAVDLALWQIGDGASFDAIVAVGGSSLMLPPGNHALILDPDYLADTLRLYDALIPDSALLLTLDGSTFGSGGWSNSSVETVTLVDSRLDTVGRFRYSPDDLLPGHSLEKIDPDSGDGPGNWIASRWEQGTPGGPNSHRTGAADLVLGSPLGDAAGLLAGGSLTLLCPVRNAGRTSVEGVRWVLFLDDNGDSRPEPGEVVADGPRPIALAPGDSTVLSARFDDLAPGWTRFGVAALLEGDVDTTSNYRIVEAYVDRAGGSGVVINEIMARPSAGGEWVELVHGGGEPVEIGRFFLADSRDTVAIGHSGWWLSPGEFAVVGADSAAAGVFFLEPGVFRVVAGFPTLNNAGDHLRLLGPGNVLHDEAPFTEAWYGRAVEAGTSLEKRAPQASGRMAANWGASVDPLGATPGRPNSLLVERGDGKAGISIHPNPFSPDGDGHDDAAVIRTAFSEPLVYLSATVFDLHGVPVRRLANGTAVPGRNELIWDGRDDGGRPLSTGAFVCMIECADEAGRRLVRKGKAIFLVRLKK